MRSKIFILLAALSFFFGKVAFISSAEIPIKQEKRYSQQNSTQENIYTLFTTTGLERKLLATEELYRRDIITKLLIELTLYARLLPQEQVRESAHFLLHAHPFSVNAVVSRCDEDKRLVDLNVLLAAALQGTPTLVEILLNNYADIYHRTSHVHGASCLHAAIYNPHERYLEIMELLIQRGALLNITDTRGNTPLALACSPEDYADLPKRDFSACMMLLITHGASCDKLSFHGRNRLFKLLPNLYEKLALLGHKELLPQENLSQHWHTNALLYAALQGYYDMVQTLVFAVTGIDYTIVKAKISTALEQVTNLYSRYKDFILHSKDVAYKNIIGLLKEQKRYYNQLSAPLPSIQTHIPTSTTVINIYTGFCPELHS